MSNHVSDDSEIPEPGDTEFDTTAGDLDAFRIEVTDNGLTGDPTSLVVTLQVGSRAPISLSLTFQSGNTYRGVFHRLVSDDVDDAVLGDQTVLGALRDLVVVRYSRGAGCVEQAAMRIGRPVDENNNDVDQSRNDVRQMRLHVVVFSAVGLHDLAVDIDATQSTIEVLSVANAHSAGAIMIEAELIEYTGLDVPNNRFTGCTRGTNGTSAQSHSMGTTVLYSTTTPVVSLGDALSDLEQVDQQFAQSGIRLRRPVAIDMGPSGHGHALPAPMLDGFTDSTTISLTIPNDDEQAIIAFKDGVANTIDVFYTNILEPGVR